MPLHPPLHLQQTVNNQAVGRPVQTKLKVGQPRDQCEQEADRVADTVVHMPEPQVQRQEEEPEEEEEETIQTKQARGQTPQADPSIASQIRSLRGDGQPLPTSARNFFEPRFGHDFSPVRVHTDGQAAEVAQAVKARACTLGRDIAFGAGQYVPGTSKGRHLLAHELTHVVQQTHELTRTSGHIQRRTKRTGRRAPSVPSSAAGPQAARPCSRRRLRRLKPVLERARSMAHRAFFGLQSVLVGRMPGIEFERQLWQHFHVKREHTKQRERILNVLRGTNTKLTGSPKFRCTAPKDQSCEDFGAYVVQGERPIYLCRRFFGSLSRANHQSPWVLVHEAAHLAGANKDHGYFITFGSAPSCSDTNSLSRDKAIDNADSYAYFAYCVSKRGGQSP
jgi:hypothetical protein